MRRHRPRETRKDGAALRYLDDWRQQVERAENQVRRPGHVRARNFWVAWDGPTGCPMCDGELDVDPRIHLEGLMRNGGRRAHRLRAAVTRLDDRYRDATIEIDTRRSLPWWRRRTPWA